MAKWLWIVWIYSFLGYLLEKLFAWWTKAENQVRKCQFLPLCPVYGLGMAAVLALPEPLRNSWLLPIVGGGVATAVEYAVHWLYQRFLGVRFWDYTALSGNLHGRVCLPFSLIWGGLVALAVWFVQPWVAVGIAKIPWQATYLALLLFVADALCACRVLRETGDVTALRLTP